MKIEGWPDVQMDDIHAEQSIGYRRCTAFRTATRKGTKIAIFPRLVSARIYLRAKKNCGGSIGHRHRHRHRRLREKKRHFIMLERAS